MQCQHGSKSSGFLTLLKRYLPLNLIYYPYILIQPDLVSLYSNPSQTDNQVTPLQNVYTSFTSHWPYVTLYVLAALLIYFYLHTLWKKFKPTHRTTLHLEITT